MQLTSIQRLSMAIAESEAIFASKSKELAYVQFRCDGKNLVGQGKLPQVTEASIREWLSKVVHNPSGKHRKVRNLATAYYVKQQIIYNPLYVEQASDDSLLDTVLHELGHLFTWHFLMQNGHDLPWRMTGTAVGYAEVGTSPMSRRARYHSFAAHKGTVEVAEAPLGRIGAVAERNQSSVESPVRLVWRICDQYPNAPRAHVIAHLVNLGVNHNTAKTQYARWLKANRFRREAW